MILSNNSATPPSVTSTTRKKPATTCPGSAPNRHYYILSWKISKLQLIYELHLKEIST